MPLTDLTNTEKETLKRSNSESEHDIVLNLDIPTDKPKQGTSSRLHGRLSRSLPSTSGLVFKSVPVAKPSTSDPTKPCGATANKRKRSNSSDSSSSDSSTSSKTSKQSDDVKTNIPEREVWTKNVHELIDTIPLFLNKRQLKINLINHLIKLTEQKENISTYARNYETKLLKEAITAIFTPYAVSAFSTPPKDYPDFITKTVKYSMWLKQVINMGASSKSKLTREKERYEGIKSVASKLICLEEKFAVIKGDDYTLINTTTALKKIAM